MSGKHAPIPWKRTKQADDHEVWTRGPYSIRVTGENAGGKPIQWGIFFDGKEMKSKRGLRLGERTIEYDRLADAKRRVDCWLVSERLGNRHPWEPHVIPPISEPGLLEALRHAEAFVTTLLEGGRRPDDHDAMLALRMYRAAIAKADGGK